MFAKHVVPVTMLFLSFSLSAEAARGGHRTRLDAMSGGDDGPVARAAAPAPASAPAPDTAHFTVPLVLSPDFTETDDINDRGVIVGAVEVGFSVFAFVFRDGVATLFLPPGAVFNSELLGVSSRGDAVGHYFDAARVDRGFLRSADGTITDLPDPAPDLVFNLPFGINARGTIVGAYRARSSSLSCVGYVLREGRYQIIDIPGATCVFPSGINDRGDIVGNWIDAARFSHGFLIPGGDRDDGARRPLVDITIDGLSTIPVHISSRGHVVGAYAIPGDQFLHGYIQRGSEFRTLDDPAGSEDTVLNGVNAAGVIVGFGANPGFLAIPTSARSSDGD